MEVSAKTPEVAHLRQNYTRLKKSLSMARTRKKNKSGRRDFSDPTELSGVYPTMIDEWCRSLAWG